MRRHASRGCTAPASAILRWPRCASDQTYIRMLRPACLAKGNPRCEERGAVPFGGAGAAPPLRQQVLLGRGVLLVCTPRLPLLVLVLRGHVCLRDALGRHSKVLERKPVRRGPCGVLQVVRLAAVLLHPQVGQVQGVLVRLLRHHELVMQLGGCLQRRLLLPLLRDRFCQLALVRQDVAAPSRKDHDHEDTGHDELREGWGALLLVALGDHAHGGVEALLPGEADQDAQPRDERLHGVISHLGVLAEEVVVHHLVQYEDEAEGHRREDERNDDVKQRFLVGESHRAHHPLRTIEEAPGVSEGEVIVQDLDDSFHRLGWILYAPLGVDKDDTAYAKGEAAEEEHLPLLASMGHLGRMPLYAFHIGQHAANSEADCLDRQKG
mmetsp:Transcript_73377/g.202534  ORF Transcript_73377/g.202534 Transcript_73377/m.202534 type:complete len:380 (-) Transcript_73377:785-1924(-)